MSIKASAAIERLIADFERDAASVDHDFGYHDKATLRGIKIGMRMLSARARGFLNGVQRVEEFESTRAQNAAGAAVAGEAAAVAVSEGG